MSAREDRLRDIRDDDDALTALKLAAETTSFVLHCALLGYEAEKDMEGVEQASGALVQLRVALERAYAPNPPPPICSGCSPIAPLEAQR